ncbi:MAG: glycosyltransferase family 4 protein [Actinomycetota bacterium]
MSARTKPTHLVEVGLSWPPETFLQWKLEGLARRGFRVTVVSFFRHGPPFSMSGVDVLHMPDWSAPLHRIVFGVAWDCLRLAVRHPRRLVALLVAFARPSRRSPVRAGLGYRPKLRRKLREEIGWLRLFLPLAALRPDVAHFEWESTAVSYQLIADVWRCPIVISCHGGLQAYGQSVSYRRVLAGLPAAFERASAVQCVSKIERTEAIRHGLDPAKARLMPCGVDPAVFSPPARGARGGNPMRLMAVGWLRWMKGYEYAVRTVRALLDAGVPARLDVFGGDPLPPVGEPSDRARILHTVSDLGLGDHVRVHGHVPTQTLVDHLRRSHAFLHSSVSEGLPVVILEAMACELPVVAADCGGVREAVRDCVEGFVVPPRDPVRAAAALERLWNEPELRERMGRAGRARVLTAFTLEGHLDGMETLYREVTTRPRSRAGAVPAGDLNPRRPHRVRPRGRTKPG